MEEEQEVVLVEQLGVLSVRGSTEEKGFCRPSSRSRKGILSGGGAALIVGGGAAAGNVAYKAHQNAKRYRKLMELSDLYLSWDFVKFDLVSKNPLDIRVTFQVISRLHGKLQC